MTCNRSLWTIALRLRSGIPVIVALYALLCVSIIYMAYSWETFNLTRQPTLPPVWTNEVTFIGMFGTFFPGCIVYGVVVPFFRKCRAGKQD